MSNHWHLVLYVDPQQPWSMTDEEVARCWLKAFPGPLKHDDSPEMEERFVQALLGNPDRLEVLRGRLGSLGWFMKALNEPIARMANREDGCTGKFWEGSNNVCPGISAGISGISNGISNACPGI